MSGKELWDARYDTLELIHGDQPSEFLRANASLVPHVGLALDLAAGEGRNAVFMAELGLEVIALDISMRALEKCQRLARERGARVETAVMDLSHLTIPQACFDVIVNFNYLQRSLGPRIIEGLRPGGVVLFETLTRDHLRFKPEFNPDFLLGPGELIDLFKGLHMIKYRETVTQEGGSSRSIASILARKDR